MNRPSSRTRSSSSIPRYKTTWSRTNSVFQAVKREAQAKAEVLKAKSRPASEGVLASA